MQRDDLTSRLHAARPETADIDPDAFDQALLDRVRAQPAAQRAPHRTARRTIARPVAAAVVAAAATAFAVLAGGPNGPSSADAVTQALHWFSPPPGTILHVRSVETQGGRTTTLEMWQSADHPDHERLAVSAAPAYETAGDALYDPATDTIYSGLEKPPVPARNAKAAAGKVAVRPGALPAGDPVVDKVRTLLEHGDMTVGAETTHDGASAFPISLNADAGRPVWTLWVSAADGRPLELKDPGRDANEPPQEIHWPTYEVLQHADATALITMPGAHPNARVVTDPAQVAAAEQRFMGPKSPATQGIDRTP